MCALLIDGLCHKLPPAVILANWIHCFSIWCVTSDALFAKNSQGKPVSTNILTFHLFSCHKNAVVSEKHYLH